MNKIRMKWLLAIGFALMSVTKAFSQIELSHMLPRQGNTYGLGYGLVLKCAFLSGDADFITVEGAAKFFFEKGSEQYGMAYFPLKAGYKYTLNREGSGIYVEPQLGFNVYGVESYYDRNYGTVNQKFNGVIAGAAVGFLFQPDKRGHQYDIGAYCESVFSQPVTAVSIGLRFSYNFSFGGSGY